MASIKTDSTANGMRNNFELAAAHLLPYDPVARKRAISGGKRNAANISAMAETEEISATTVKKPSIGRTGVHLRYYKQSEYKSLTQEQKDELREWRTNNPLDKKSGKKAKGSDAMPKSKKFTKKQIAAIVAKQVEAEMKKSAKSDENTTDDENGEAYLTSMVEAAVAKTLKPEDDKSATNRVYLKSILKKAQNCKH